MDTQMDFSPTSAGVFSVLSESEKINNTTEDLEKFENHIPSHGADDDTFFEGITYSMKTNNVGDNNIEGVGNVSIVSENINTDDTLISNDDSVDENPAVDTINQSDSLQIEDDKNHSTSIDDERKEDSNKTRPQSKTVRLPLSRVKLAMKTDPDTQLVTAEAVIVMAKATELFIRMLTKETVRMTLADKKKTLMKKHMEAVTDRNIRFFFLKGTI